MDWNSIFQGFLMAQKNDEDDSTQAEAKRAKPRARLLHELLESELESDLETTVVQERTNEPDRDPRSSRSSEKDSTAAQDAIDIDIDLPQSSDEDFLPIFAPPVTSPRLLKPTPIPSRATPPAGSKKSRQPSEPLESIFEEMENSTAPQKTVPPVYAKEKSTPSGQIPRPPTPREGVPTGPAEGRERPRFATGTTGGIQPLDISEFEGTSSSRRSRSHEKEKKVLIISGPAPMASSSRVMRQRFTLSLRDVLLLALVILLGIGIWLGYRIYQDLQIRSDLKKLQEATKLIDEKKQEELRKILPKTPAPER